MSSWSQALFLREIKHMLDLAKLSYVISHSGMNKGKIMVTYTNILPAPSSAEPTQSRVKRLVSVQAPTGQSPPR